MKRFFSQPLVAAAIIASLTGQAFAGAPKAPKAKKETATATTAPEPKKSIFTSEEPTELERQYREEARRYNVSSEQQDLNFSSIYEGIITDQVVRKAQVGGTGVVDALPKGSNSVLTLNDLQGAFFGSMVRFISEHPALGGNPDRGFEPKIIGSILNVYFQYAVPVTPDGVLLLPQSTSMAIASHPKHATQQALANGDWDDVAVKLVDAKTGEILDKSLRPRGETGYETIDGQIVVPGSLTSDFLSLAQLSSVFNAGSLQVASVTDSSPRAYFQQLVDYSLSKCFTYVAGGDMEKSSACFSGLGKEVLAEGVKLSKNLINTGIRGGATGAVGGTLVPGVGSAGGAIYGAFTNMITVIYNSYFRKEKVTPHDIQNVIDWVMRQTTAPTETGDLLPMHGRWYRDSTGVIRQAMTEGGVVYKVARSGERVKRKISYSLKPGSGVMISGQNRALTTPNK